MRLLLITIFLCAITLSCSNNNEQEGLPPAMSKIHEEAKRTALKTIESGIEIHDDHYQRQKKVSFKKQVKPILDNRCVVCHSCYDSPCQLKLTSKEGIQRGATQQKVYEGDRLISSKPTRLYVDAFTTEQWREKDFFEVSNKHMNRNILAKMLRLKEIVPLPETTILPASLDFSLANDRFCPKEEDFDSYAEASPFGGMPYGLPALTSKENQTIMTWLAQGSKFEKEVAIPNSHKKMIKRWEKFLNKSSKKGQLMSRYLYEHLYLANLYFSKDKRQQRYYKIIRSKTPPGKPIEVIATRRPFDDPEVERVYYRITKQRETIVDKTHMPYLFDLKRMGWYSRLFLKPKFRVKQLPSYEPGVASNPFEAFKDLPVKSRYEFLLKESMYTISNFIKGPVCRGQIALNVIQDHFWTFFVSPELYDSKKFFSLEDELTRMSLPAEFAQTRGGIQWLKYKNEEEAYLEKKSQFLDKNKSILKLSSIWDGDGINQNAALTIFRHFDSATVVKGMVGQNPKTAWVINYPLLERIHYLLVAGFDVYGNLSHQLNTRLYMDFLRLEGEFNFLALLPSKTRIKERNHWYEKAVDDVKEHILGRHAWIEKEPQINYRTNDPKKELFGLLKKRLNKVLNKDFDVQNEVLSSLMDETSLEGTDVSLFSQVSLLLIEDTNEVYSLVHNNAHYNISHLLTEGSQRVTKEDNFTVTRGIIGSYPNTIFRIKSSQISNFVTGIRNTTNESSYRRLLDLYGVRRSDKRFWPTLDKIHELTFESKSIEYGLLDLNRLENR